MNIQKFQAAIWKRAHLPEYDVHATTNGHGWKVFEDSMEPAWNSIDILPQSVVDMLAEELLDVEAEEQTMIQILKVALVQTMNSSVVKMLMKKTEHDSD